MNLVHCTPQQAENKGAEEPLEQTLGWNSTGRGFGRAAEGIVWCNWGMPSQQQFSRLRVENVPFGGCLLRCLFLLAALFVGGAGTVRAGMGAMALHPVDGPDVDCRIRVDEGAVVFQITMNLAFVDQIVEFDREQESSLLPGELDGLQKLLFQHFADVNLVHIDGIEITPLLVPLEPLGFTPADPSALSLFPLFGARALAKVRLVLSYSAKSSPKDVQLIWGDFPIRGGQIDSDVDPVPMEINAQLSANGEDELIVFTQEQPQVSWSGSLVDLDERFLAIPEIEGCAMWDVPLPSAGLACLCIIFGGVALFGTTRLRSAAVRSAFGALALAAVLQPYGHVQVPALGQVDSGLPDSDDARRIFQPLQANIYRAFDYEEEGDIYDALSRSVEGPLLSELYRQVYGSLVQEEAGGAVSHVRKVELLDAEIGDIKRDASNRPSFRVQAKWRVEGVVFHWGHAHVRVNEYSARYLVRHGTEGWRIASSEPLSERRINAVPILPARVLAAEDQDQGTGFRGAASSDIPLGSAPTGGK